MQKEPNQRAEKIPLSIGRQQPELNSHYPSQSKKKSNPDFAEVIEKHLKHYKGVKNINFQSKFLFYLDNVMLSNDFIKLFITITKYSTNLEKLDLKGSE